MKCSERLQGLGEANFFIKSNEPLHGESELCPSGAEYVCDFQQLPAFITQMDKKHGRGLYKDSWWRIQQRALVISLILVHVFISEPCSCCPRPQQIRAQYFPAIFVLHTLHLRCAALSINGLVQILFIQLINIDSPPFQNNTTKTKWEKRRIG